MSECTLSNPRAGAPSADPPLGLPLTALSACRWVLPRSRRTFLHRQGFYQSQDHLPAASTLVPPPTPAFASLSRFLVLAFSPLPPHPTSQPGFLADLTHRERKPWGPPAPPHSLALWALLHFDTSWSITRPFWPVAWTSCRAASTVTLLSATHVQHRSQEPLRLSLGPPHSDRFPPS